MVRKVPDVIESFRELAPPLLNDRHHGVLLSGVTLALQICELEASAVVEYRMHVSALACMGPTAAHDADEKCIWCGALGRLLQPACILFLLCRHPLTELTTLTASLSLMMAL